MKANSKAVGWGILLAVAVGVFVVAHRIHRRKRVLSISGAVIRLDPDPRKQIPIAHVMVSLADDLATGNVTTDSNGFFYLQLRKGIKPGEGIALSFRRSGYKPLDIEEIAGDRIYLGRMAPLAPTGKNVAPGAQVAIGNIDIRYSVKTSGLENVGTVVRTFQVTHAGSQRCGSQAPCSPDRKWKAASGEMSLDAGEGNEFQGVRISCIAGPCPFTLVLKPSYSADERMMNLQALDWSDTATFLVEAEVERVMVSSESVESFPITFGEALNFAVPDGAEGVTIEADLNGQAIVFPLGPDLILSWADCTSGTSSEKARAFRCVLKPGYRFQ